MLKHILLVSLLSFSMASMADSDRGEHHRDMHESRYEGPVYRGPVVVHENDHYYHRDTGDVLVPMIIGGVVGYVLAQPKSTPQPQASVPSASGNSKSRIIHGEPLYQYQIIHDMECDCDKRVLNRVN